MDVNVFFEHVYFECLKLNSGNFYLNLALFVFPARLTVKASGLESEYFNTVAFSCPIVHFYYCVLLMSARPCGPQVHQIFVSKSLETSVDQ